MVRFALLGLLREQRDYGYRLKRRFDDRVGMLWHLNIGQVYQTLRSMQRTGLVVEVDDGAGDDAQLGRRLFELTAKGRRVLDRWLLRPPSRPRPVRDETLIRLLLLEPGNWETALARIDAQDSLYRRHLARLLAEKRRMRCDAGSAGLVGHLGLEAALLQAEAHLKWLEYCRQRLQEQKSNAVTVQEPVTVPAAAVEAADVGEVHARPRALRMA
jgi:DNA-binding PadR family transcriptional regulator